MTNRDFYISKVNEYDLLLRIHENLAVRNTTCVLEAIDKNFKCTTDSGTCAECIQKWLNEERK